MKICIMGAGKMGMFMADTLCMDHDVAVYARRPEKLRYCLNTPHQCGNHQEYALSLRRGAA